MVLIGVGCDQTFDPFGEGDQHLSVFGFLNVSADTQWVRVMPIREALVSSRELADAIVTLEHRGTGHLITLNRATRRFQDPFLGEGTSVTVHNYWTTEKILPGSEYQFTATLANGRGATATVRTPPEITSVVVGIQKDQVNGYVRFSGVPNLAMVRVLHDGLLYVYQPLRTSSTSSFLVDVTTAVDCRLISCPTTPEVEIVGSGEAWPRGNQFATSALNVPDLLSNVTNAVGFLGGVVVKRVPFETCVFEPEGGPASVCELTYNAETATLEGTVLDASCESEPIAGAAVRLREIPASPTSIIKVRPVTTDDQGHFRISGLDPGRGYALTITHQVPTPDGEPRIWLPYTETRVFQRAERVAIQVGLTRLECN